MRKLIAGFSITMFMASTSFAAIVTIDENNNILRDGKPFIPIMQWLQPTGMVDKNAKLGINTFTGIWQQTTSEAIKYLEAYKAKNVWGVIGFDSTAAVKNHPALLGWIFGDEPDLESNKIQPGVILSEYTAIKKADRNHPAFLTVTSAFFDGLFAWMQGNDSYYYDYCAATDIVGFDKYPVYGWCRKDWIYTVGNAQDSLRLKYAKQKHPTYQWIECVTCCSKWCDYTERQNKGPFPNEIRCEVWLALVHGAKAIGYFTHSWRSADCQQKGDSYYTNYQVTAEQEAELTRTNKQITDLTPVICQKPSDTVSYTITGGAGRVDIMTRIYNGTLYIFAINVLHTAKNNTQTVAYTVPFLGQTGKKVMVYEESRTLTPNGDTFTDSITEKEPVHIYTIEGINSIGNNHADAYAHTSRYHLRQRSLNTAQKFLKLSFFLPEQEKISLKIIDIRGRFMATIYEGTPSPGLHTILWNGRDLRGNRAAGGIYVCLLQGASGNSREIILLTRQ